MPCIVNCLNGGICSFNGTCLCSPCYMGTQCEIHVNVVKFSLTYTMHWDIRQASKDSDFNVPEFMYTTIIAIMVLMALVNNITCLQTFFLHEIRFTNCGIFQILYCFTGLITLIGMQLRMLTMLVFDSLTQAYTYRYIACSIIPVMVILMGDVCMWLSTLLVIEFVLVECFNFNLYRSRWFSAISSIICYILVTSSHLHEMIARHPLPDPYEPKSYTCTYLYTLPIDTIDKVLRTIHVLIPCVVHFIASIYMLINISQRFIEVRGRKDFYRVLASECIKRKHFFVPPLFIILSNLPHLTLHLRDGCEDARDITALRIHAAFNILVYLPPSVTFFIYIYPSESYMHQFKKTFIGRWLKRIFQRQKPKVFSMKLRRMSRETLTSVVLCTPKIIKNDIS